MSSSTSTPSSIPVPNGTPSAQQPNNLLNIFLFAFGASILINAFSTIVYHAYEPAQGEKPATSRQWASIIFALTSITTFGILIFGAIVMFGSAGNMCKTSLVDGAIAVYKCALAVWIVGIIGFIILAIIIVLSCCALCFFPVK
jgi:hypothetical protein